MRALLRIACAVGIAGSVLAASVPPARAETTDWKALAHAAQTARDAAALRPVLGRLERAIGGLGPGSEPDVLAAAADAVGAAVARARRLGADPALSGQLVGLGDALATRVAKARAAREQAAGESDQALAALYGSKDWQRLEYADVVAGYWAAWARLGRAEGLPQSDASRTALLRKAEAEFARGTIEVRLPRLARESLLGLGLAREGLGDTRQARKDFESLEKLLDTQSDDPLRTAIKVELARIALEEGHIEDAEKRIAALPPNALSPKRRLAFLESEASAWLKRARAGKGGAERAAALLREISAAGGEAESRAAALALAYHHELRGLRVGPVSDLIEGEEAFDAHDFAKASGAYRRFLGTDLSVPGLDRAVVDYKYAVSLSRTGARDESLERLDHLLAHGGGGSVRRPAARLFFALAAQAAKDDGSRAAAARVQRAARLLLQVAPDAPEADAARVRLAQARDRGRASRSSLELLDQVDPTSDAYPAALLERVRIRASRLERLERVGRVDSAEGRSTARALEDDLDRVAGLRKQGRLAPDPKRDASLAVLAAEAAAWSGAPAKARLARVEAAATQPGLDASARRELLRIRLAAWSELGRFNELASALEKPGRLEDRVDWEVWYQLLQHLESQRRPTPPDSLLLSMAGRLETTAPKRYRSDAQLQHARLLLRAGHAKQAADQAHRLVQADDTWGDAWFVYARAAEAAGSAKEALAAWRRVADGVKHGGRLWLEAEIGVARSARHAGDAASACGAVAAVRKAAPQLAQGRLKRELTGLAEGCPPASPNGKAAASGDRAPAAATASEP